MVIYYQYFQCVINNQVLCLIIYNQTCLEEKKIFFMISLKYFEESEILNFEMIQIQNTNRR